MKPSTFQVGGDHYKNMPIQPHYFCHVNKLGALESNVIKYVCRHSTKHGKADLLKAKHYIELLLEWQYGDDGHTSPAIDDTKIFTRNKEITASESAGPRFPDADALSMKTRLETHGQTWQCYPDNWPHKDDVGDLTEPTASKSLLCACGYLRCSVCNFP